MINLHEKWHSDPIYVTQPGHLMRFSRVPSIYQVFHDLPSSKNDQDGQIPSAGNAWCITDISESHEIEIHDLFVQIAEVRIQTRRTHSSSTIDFLCSSRSKFHFQQNITIKPKHKFMANINNCIKALLHPAGGHQGSHKAHKAGNQSI